MRKELKDKLLPLILWFVPFIFLLFGFYRFALKPSVYLLVLCCIACCWLGWLLKSYFEV